MTDVISLWNSLKKELHLLDEDVLHYPPPHIPELNQLLNGIWQSGGKKLRPSLVFLCARILNVTPEMIKPYARAAEMVHTATLLHDDVIDQANFRRGKPSTPQVYGNMRAVLSGDFLLAEVMRELNRLGNFEANCRLSETLAWMVEGEWLQNSIIGRTDVTAELSVTIAERKTASLLMWCCEVPGIIAHSPPEVLEKLKSYGRNLGLAFQLQDDALDFQENAVSGKPRFQDLRQGLMNGVAVALNGTDTKTSAWLKSVIESKSEEERETNIACWIERKSAIDEAVSAARTKAGVYLKRAEEAAIDTSLVDVARLVMARTS